MMMDSAESRTSTINIRQWVESASKLPSTTSCVQSAVSLAWALTRHLVDLGASEGAPLELLLEQGLISAENVTIEQTAALEIKRVRFLCEDAVSLLSKLRQQRREDRGPSTASQQREVCVALGEILLEIFSRGRSGSLEGYHRSRRKADEKIDANNVERDGCGSISKRMADVSIGDSASQAARDLSIALGMPLSACRLVNDLLCAADEPRDDGSNEITLEDALRDLAEMRSNPELFLVDCACAKKAVDDATRSGHLFGREQEMKVLLDAKDRVASHHARRTLSDTDDDVNFMSDAIFLSGYAGSGKSRLVSSLMSACAGEGWIVLSCKFDKRAAPATVFAAAFDEFFASIEREGPPHLQVCRGICSALDDDGLCQLCEIVPSFSRILPSVYSGTGRRGQDRGLGSSGGGSLVDRVGDAEQRLVYLFSLLLRELCSVGIPVLFALDDVQWSDSRVLKCVADFLVSTAAKDMSGITTDGGSNRQGLLIVAAFRSNEVGEQDDLMEHIKTIKGSEKATTTIMTVGKLTKKDITNLISSKLLLPPRYTRRLAEILQLKTKGNPFFILQILKTIIQNKMLEFSLKTRRWEWDCDVIEMQMISEGVAGLLTSSFHRLPKRMMQTLKIVSCFGHRVDDTIVDLLNDGHQVLSFDMLPELKRAMEEGLLEKAGPVYQFTHDLIQQAVSDLIPNSNRKLLHKTIGSRLLMSAGEEPKIALIAVDQINIYCKDGDLSPDDRALYASGNAAAAKSAIASSNFEKAKTYTDMGLRLLDVNHWQNQYRLSLELFEMKALVSSAHGDVVTSMTSLNAVLANARSFGDTLNASAMLSKNLASLSKHDEAITTILSILSKLDVHFPPRADHSSVLSELASTLPLMQGLTFESAMELPKMSDPNKLNAMKFLGMLSRYSLTAAPMLLALVGCRMVKITVETSSFCDYSIIGMIVVCHSMYLFSNETFESYRIGKVAERLINKAGSNKHRLRSEICSMWHGGLKIMVEPCQAVISLYPQLYESAMQVGDAENAIRCCWSYCIASFYAGEGLVSLSKYFRQCIDESVKYQLKAVHQITLAVFRASILLSGNHGTDNIPSYADLYRMAKDSNNPLLSFHVSLSEICVKFWFRDYLGVIQLCQKYPPLGHSRILFFMRCFYEGIASLCLARQTAAHRLKWRIVGEGAVKALSELEAVSEWNFKNLADLLRAERHYMLGRLGEAEESYKASIEAARRHRFLHEEALAYELYGIFCIENRMVRKGMEALGAALDKYEQWGGSKKVDELRAFIDTVNPATLHNIYIKV